MGKNPLKHQENPTDQYIYHGFKKISDILVRVSWLCMVKCKPCCVDGDRTNVQPDLVYTLKKVI